MQAVIKIRETFIPDIKVLIHVGDMPQHGTRFHNGFPKDSFSHSNDEDPRGLKIEDLLASVKAKKIAYYFGKITHHTDKMIKVNYFRFIKVVE